MEQINILFFLLSSFFALENSQIVADKTSVTIDPIKQEIKIIQKDLFTFIKNEKDTTLVLKQWDKLYNWNEKDTPWSTELDSFSCIHLTYITSSNKIQPYLTLKYLNEKNLEVFGVWYNAEKDQFSINNIPKENIKTQTGILEDNYWVFKGDSTFCFTIEPLVQLPEHYLKCKQPLEKLLKNRKKTN